VSNAAFVVIQVVDPTLQVEKGLPLGHPIQEDRSLFRLAGGPGRKRHVAIDSHHQLRRFKTAEIGTRFVFPDHVAIGNFERSLLPRLHRSNWTMKETGRLEAILGAALGARRES
jgi:hypothetical protein